MALLLQLLSLVLILMVSAGNFWFVVAPFFFRGLESMLFFVPSSALLFCPNGFSFAVLLEFAASLFRGGYVRPFIATPLPKLIPVSSQFALLVGLGSALSVISSILCICVAVFAGAANFYTIGGCFASFVVSLYCLSFSLRRLAVAQPGQK